LIKGLLELTEHPEEEYEKIVAIAAASEGLSRAEIGSIDGLRSELCGT
jgi:hypothetical protein